jgi:DNA processing protein
MVALLRAGGRAWTAYIMSLRREGLDRVSAVAVLESELGLLSYEALANAQADVDLWRAQGYEVLPMFHPDYPDNLRVIENRPPLLFVSGQLRPADQRSVAVIGTRSPSSEGLALAAELATALSLGGFTVVSGLAAGIDARVHRSVLELAAQRGGQPGTRTFRTLAVIGTGLDHAYPPENAGLQDEIAGSGAVISQFWPDQGPTRQSFPARNAVMSGLTLGSVIVEASQHSGTRIQARHALAQGRTIVLMAPVLRNDWAQELATQPGVRVADDAAAALDIFRR